MVVSVGTVLALLAFGHGPLVVSTSGCLLPVVGFSSWCRRVLRALLLFVVAVHTGESDSLVHSCSYLDIIVGGISNPFNSMSRPSVVVHIAGLALLLYCLLPGDTSCRALALSVIEAMPL
jgi:hypothetical protein